MTPIVWTLCFVVGTGIFCFQIYRRLTALLKLRTDDERDYSLRTWSIRLKNTLIYVFGQLKFIIGEQPSGWMHIIIFWGFLVLSLQVITMFGRGWVPSFQIPGLGQGPLGNAYALTKDCFQIAVLIVAGLALFRWTVQKPKRLMGLLPAEQKLHDQPHGEAALILILIGLIMVSGFFYDAGLAAITPEATQLLNWQPVTQWLTLSLGDNPSTAQNVVTISWWSHNLFILFFLNLLPRSKHFHIITVIPNVFLGKIEPKGKLPKRDLEASDPLFGRSVPVQFTRKQALDMYTCTECGRCSAECPATLTKKPLAPRQFLIQLRDSLYQNQTKIIKGAKREDFDVIVGEGKPVSDDVIWACVNCRACEQACPVNIEYIDKINDIRQHLVQEASRFPEPVGRALRGMEVQSNPWGISPEEKLAWTKGMDIPTVASNPGAEYLFFVGCGGALDASAKKGTQSFAKILKAAKVSFATLGADEPCCGDSARRLGNEYLFQTMAQRLVEVINSTGIWKILINCPHGYNTLKNEYPDFGGHWEVIHAAAFVEQLVVQGKIKLATLQSSNIVYHDSCNYGRYNDIYSEPRALIGRANGNQPIEMDKNLDRATCCGAGGGLMWLEEDKDKRVNILRTAQAMTSKPDVVATSCPFCRIMFESAISEKYPGDNVRVMDVMEIVAASLRE